MEKPFFINNCVNGSNREEPLDLFQFMKELEEVFRKYGVNDIKGGFVGFNPDDAFIITGAYLDIQSKGLKL